MKITDIETIILESPFEYGIADGEESTGPKYSCIVRVLTDEGITGVGDIDSHPHVVRAVIEAPTATANLIAGLRDALIGQNPLETDLLWDRMYDAAYYHGRRGAVIQAMSGIDIALWDIKGKYLGQSVSTLLGGRYHERIKAYASTLFRPTPDGMKRAVDKYRRAGYRAIKFGWGAYTENPLYGVELIKAAREEAGCEIELMVDGYITKRDVAFAAGIIKRLEEFGVFWVEEPLPSDNLDGFKQLASKTAARIATGEQLGGRHEYRELIERANPSVVQFDISRCGGITEAKRIIFLAQMYSKSVCPHAWTSDFLTAASLHLNANTDTPLFQEFCTNASPTSRELAVTPLALDADGYIAVPRASGLGVELDMRTVKKYRVK